MAAAAQSEITDVLIEISKGDQEAVSRLMPLVYDKFRALAGNYLRSQQQGHTLQPTDLVHEAYLKLVDQERVDWNGRTHFFAVGAKAMRQILVDHARGKGREKRGGGRQRVELQDQLAIATDKPEEVLAIEEALTKLAELDPRQAKIVELRFFGGMTAEEIAAVLGVSRQTVQKQWRYARAWLQWELGGDK